MSFTDLVLESVAPWADANGAWNAYNAALGVMFEPVYSIVADRGDTLQTTVATLSATLPTTEALTALPVAYISENLSVGTPVSVSFGGDVQIFTVSEDVVISSVPFFQLYPTHLLFPQPTLYPGSQGGTEIPVLSETPLFPFPSGTPVNLTFQPGWSILLDPGQCPDEFLVYLAQFNGTDVPVGLDPAVARAKILGESALHRGTTASITAAVQRNLVEGSTKFVVVEERIEPSGNANAYWFIVIVRPEQIVVLQDLINSVNAVKPGGVQWTLVQTDGWTITQMEASQATITPLEANFVTLNGLEQDLPGR